MIRRELQNQLIDLEMRIAAAVQEKSDKVNAPLRYAREHAEAVAAVALYGEPKIDEPLRNARLRMQEKLDKEFAEVTEELWIRDWGQRPHASFRAELFPVFYPSLMFDNLPGDDRSKFEQIFFEAPVWLLKFTAIEWDAKLLGFKLPKLVGAPELGREARLERNNWPQLPEGTIDAGGPCTEPEEPWETIVERRCREPGLTWRRELLERRTAL
jgi:hypothetical protein